MEVADLMIGDWVYDGHHTAQIVGIKYDGIIETTYHKNSNITVLVPIPITPEILEKNGFERNEISYYETYFYNYETHFYIELYDCTIGIPEFDVGNRVDVSGVLQSFTTIKYIHELQHVLKLCGINKEIRL